MMKPEAIDVIYSDDTVIVVDKPGGMLTTPAHGEGSLIDLLNQRYFGRFQLFVVHRLDRGTSGLLVFARTPAAARSLSEQFAKHSTDREYVALVKGHVPEAEGFIEHPVNGKNAKTYYQVVQRLRTTTMLRLKLQTGRRNQIRYHVSALGFPVIGDERIGGSYAQSPQWQLHRIALHARSLGFFHPVRKSQMHFEAQIPGDLQEFIESETSP